jgi:hypothetical protein
VVHGSRNEDGEPHLAVVEIGSGEVLELPYTFVEFHERLIEEQRAAFLSENFNEWKLANLKKIPLDTSSCVGYKVPLFLGGQDEIENLDVVSLDVYWSINGQLRLGVKGLPEEIVITEITGGNCG